MTLDEFEKELKDAINFYKESFERNKETIKFAHVSGNDLSMLSTIKLTEAFHKGIIFAYENILNEFKKVENLNGI